MKKTKEIRATVELKSVLGDLKEMMKSGDVKGAMALMGPKRTSKQARSDVAEQTPHSDPIIGAIQAYRNGSSAFNARPEYREKEDELKAIAETYGPPTKVLEEWTTPARTIEGALAALKLIRDDVIIEHLGISLLEAAIGYLEGVSLSARHHTLSEAPAAQDHLYEAIITWRTALDGFNSVTDPFLAEPRTPDEEENYICQVYGDHQAVLENWNQPAETARGALEAMRVISERALFQDLSCEPLCRAVLGYLAGKVTGDMRTNMVGTAVSEVSPPTAPILEANPQSDALVDAINAYRSGASEFEAIPADQLTSENEVKIYQRTCGVPMKRLVEWDRPASSREGSIEALKFMAEQEVFAGQLGESLSRAVLGYLEQGELQQASSKVDGHENMAFLEMFSQWSELRKRDDAGTSEEEYRAIFERYSDLHDRIVQADTLSSKEAAIQLFVATDGFDSELPEEFQDKIRALVAT